MAYKVIYQWWYLFAICAQKNATGNKTVPVYEVAQRKNRKCGVRQRLRESLGWCCLKTTIIVRKKSRYL